MTNLGWKKFVRTGSLWFTAFALVLLGAGAWFAIEFWDWLHPSTSQHEASGATPGASSENIVSNSETLRNVGLLIGGGLAFVFAVWRAWIAEHQSAAAQRQAETAQLQAENVESQIAIAQSQAETAQQSLLNERYQRGAEMLGNKVLPVRLGGIYALKRLAEEYPERYHIQIMQLFCAFARNPPESKEERMVHQYAGNEPTHRLREDVQAVMTAIGRRSRAGIDLENAAEDFKLDLRDADLHGASLEGANLAGADLIRAKLDQADLRNADLSRSYLGFANLDLSYLIGTKLPGADLFGTKLSRTVIQHTDFTLAKFFGVNLSGAVFLQNTHMSFSESDIPDSYLTRLTQFQLDQARADPDNPPKLNGVPDPVTGEPLVWGSQPLTDVQG